MKTASRYAIAFILSLGMAGAVDAQSTGPFRIHTRGEVENLNAKLAGQVLDFTYNHRVDRRFFSPALDEKRDMYVYLPPGYDKCKQYPLLIWLHGFGQDEKHFLEISPMFDRGMACGEVPPMIIAAPDGSVLGRPSLFNTGSFYINSKAGRFEDYIMRDVWNFMHETFPIRCGRESHILGGTSMGGYGAVNLGIKHRDRVGVVAGIMPPLNLRYRDCRGKYFGDFNPDCTELDDRLRPHSAVARFYGGLVVIRQRRMTDPLYGRGPGTVEAIAAENPIEMLDAYNVKPGELELYVGFGKKDEFNIDAQVESFLFAARNRGIEVAAFVDPEGRHNSESGRRFYSTLAAWISQRVPTVK